MDVFDIEIGAGLQVRHVTPSLVDAGRRRRGEKTLRDVNQSIRNNSILKFITVCKRFNIDPLHPLSFAMVLALLSKTEDRLQQFERIDCTSHEQAVILDMDVVRNIEHIDSELLYSVMDWVNLLQYMECRVCEDSQAQLSDDVLVSRFVASLRAGGLDEVLHEGMPTILLCMMHTFPSNTPISQMLERFVVNHFAKARDVEVRCLRTATHYMDTVIPDAIQQVSMALVMNTLAPRQVFTTDVQYVLQQEDAIRCMSQLNENPERMCRLSLRKMVETVQNEKTYNSIQSFDNWRSQMQFGVTTSLHLQLLMYFITAQTVEADVSVYQNLYTEKILERVSRRNHTIDNIDHVALSRLIKSVRIYKHCINNLIDFRSQCLQGFNVKTRTGFSLAQIVQLYICCFQHKSVFEYAWKQVVPIMNHTISTACQRFRENNVFDCNAVIRTLIDSNTVLIEQPVLKQK